jgi:hypothetical protein
MHPVLLNLLIVVSRSEDGATWFPADNALFALVLVPLLSVVLTWCAVRFYDISGRIRLRWLFAPPALPGRSSR